MAIRNTLLSIAPIDGRYQKITEALEDFTSEYALIKTRVEIEIYYLIAIVEFISVFRLSTEEKEILLNIADNFDLTKAERVKEIEKTTNHDVKAVEMFIAESLKDSSLNHLIPYIHIFLTSEDINNLAYRIMYSRAINNIYLPALTKLCQNMAKLADDWKEITILGRTHGQAAIPTTLGKEISIFVNRLNKQIHRLQEHKLTGKVNGAIGNYNVFKAICPHLDWCFFSAKFVNRWNFDVQFYTNQINPFDDMVESFQIIQLINNVMIGFNQDIWRYISDGWLGQIKKDGEIGSSVMTQKINPINYENGEGNYKSANGVWEFLIRELPISRLQRDLVNSTEIRNVGCGLAYGLIAIENTIKGLGKIYPNFQNINDDLKNNWNILGEAVQNALRFEGFSDAYKIVEQFTKGKNLNQETYLQQIDQLPLSNQMKEKLQKLTPLNYIGDAIELTTQVIDDIILD